jgi:glycine hydroxymethyltransferase/Rap guanine nucleotide exchange factor 1
LEIQCATLNKLVERLTFPDYNADDKVYMKVFIATYEDFTSPQRLLKKLVQRFRVPEGKMNKESMEQIQSRVCSVIKVMLMDTIAQEIL